MISWRAWPVFVLVQVLGLLQFSEAATSTSSKLLQATPAPLVVPPSQVWDGNDGPWSSFFLRVGSPPQTVRVLLSTASNQPLVVLPQGCYSDDTSDCANSRGGLFQTNSSSTWTQNNVTAEGVFSLAIENNVGLSGEASYGTDTVAVGYVGSGAPALDGQNVGGITTKTLFMGVFGVNPAATNFSASSKPVQSYMANLKAQKQIPSLSYGYTAGNKYRFDTVLASLTLGGYDASLIVPNDLKFRFSNDTSSELMVNVNAITISSQEGGVRGLNSAAFPAVIDSTIPYMYLPIDVCRQFEDAFNLNYDYDSGLYFVDDALHTELVQQAANVTFTLKNSTSVMDVDIVLPYAAFDLVAKWPLVQNTTRYFPLKRAVNNSQTILGRAFLQEAYLVADYERSHFSIHQMKWDPNAKGDIQTILPLSTTTTPTYKRRKLPTAVIVAICVGGALFLTVFVSCVIIIRQRHQKLRAINSPKLNSKSSTQSLEGAISPYSAFTFKSELDARETQQMSPASAAAPFGSTTIRIRAFHEPEEIHELPAREPIGSEVVGSPVEVMLQQTIDSILEQHYRERMQESQARPRDEGRDLVAEEMGRKTHTQVGAPASLWIRYG
ncbi:aspartic peptidase domain-containing protein [Rhexocercosporidium sp. MPI-PUGE-AT-0058]|nr:aspartic peptidase domain-containing protein [Rhexocercosporidium sp. MPI-PUGE-AT-0058]